MVEIQSNPKEIMKELKSKPRELKNLLLRKSPDRKLLLYFSLGYLAQMYMDNAEQMMKEGKSIEKDYFSRKSMQIKAISRKVFGQSPERDIYTGEFKVPKTWAVEMDKGEIDQLAQFCVQNLPESPNLRDPETIQEFINKKLKTYKKTAVVKKFIKEIKNTMENTKNPTKLLTLLELTALLENVNEVLEAVKEEQEEEEETEEEEEPKDTEENDKDTEGTEELEGIKKEGISVDEIK